MRPALAALDGLRAPKSQRRDVTSSASKTAADALPFPLTYSRAAFVTGEKSLGFLSFLVEEEAAGAGAADEDRERIASQVGCSHVGQRGEDCPGLYG